MSDKLDSLKDELKKEQTICANGNASEYHKKQVEFLKSEIAKLEPKKPEPKKESEPEAKKPEPKNADNKGGK